MKTQFQNLWSTPSALKNSTKSNFTSKVFVLIVQIKQKRKAHHPFKHLLSHAHNLCSNFPSTWHCHSFLHPRWASNTTNWKLTLVSISQDFTKVSKCFSKLYLRTWNEVCCMHRQLLWHLMRLESNQWRRATTNHLNFQPQRSQVQVDSQSHRFNSLPRRLEIQISSEKECAKSTNSKEKRARSFNILTFASTLYIMTPASRKMCTC